MEILTGGVRLRRATSALLLIGLMMANPSHVFGQEQDEYAVKAAYIFNFSKFVEWPPTNGSGAFEICILGDDPFDSTIDQLIHGRSAYGHSFQVRRIKGTADAKSCRIVFVGSADRTMAAKLVDAVRGTSVLTVGETQDFLRIGGMIALQMEDSHVQIIINANAAQSANLRISAKLLMMARIYKSD